VAGELHIGGAVVGRGYLNRPELTAERFLPDGFSRESGARLYKTGDEVRFCEDGRIEYLGRKDDQIKLRGYRIELTEIEAVLKTHPMVTEAAVIVKKDDRADDAKLIGYVTLRKQRPANNTGNSRLSGEELLAYLNQRLPDYMVPYPIVKLDRMPLTGQGKVDRRALPPPDESGWLDHMPIKRPQNPIEELLLEIWKEVLMLNEIGVDQNFFALGGHSLLATRLVSAVREGFSVEIPLRTLFEQPTIAELAVAIVQSQAEQLDDEESSKLLADLESLSEEEALTMLDSRGKS
jgi:acyl carrier protein